MRNLRRLKYGTALLVVSCIVGGFLALSATLLFAVQDIIFEMYPEFLFVENIGQVFITAGIMLMVVSALLIVGGIKSRFSRAWTIFLVVASSIITVLGFSEFDV